MAFDFTSLCHFVRAWVTEAPLTPRRLAVIVAFCLAFPVVEAVIWAGLWLDDLFFPGHRKQEVRGPVFIVGNFRSGTTFLHRLMARDRANFTTMRMWEILFAPSLTMRRVVEAFLALQRAVGGLAGRWVRKVEAGWEEKNVTHRVSFDEPEEDDYLLLHVFSTLTVGLASGLVGLARPYARFDQALPPGERRRIMEFYKACVRRHLHGAGAGGLRYLAKNPALIPKLETVYEHFPDARVVMLVREPAETLASTASMMRITWSAVGAGEIDDVRREFLIEMAAHWYAYPARFAQEQKPVVFVRYEELVADPKGVVASLYERLGLALEPSFAEFLETEAEKARSYQSRHVHSLEDAGIDPRRVEKEFEALPPPCPQAE